MKEVEIFNKCTEIALSENCILPFLQSPEKVKHFFYSLGLQENSPFIPEVVSGLISSFSNLCKADVSNFFENCLDTDSIALAFIKYLHENNLYDVIISGSKKFICAIDGSFDSKNSSASWDWTVKNILSGFNKKKEIKIFGFGLGNAIYENELKDCLLKSKKAEKVDIYGYDPYSCSHNSFTPYTKTDLYLKKGIHFDLIIARWSLHHVRHTERWNDFINALNLLAPSGTAIIIEHGFIQNDLPFNNERLYLFLNAVMDVIGNVIFNQEWIANAKNSGLYFLDFMKSNDIDIILKNTIRPLQCKIINTGPVFPWCSLIMFK